MSPSKLHAIHPLTSSYSPRNRREEPRTRTAGRAKKTQSRFGRCAFSEVLPTLHLIGSDDPYWCEFTHFSTTDSSRNYPADRETWLSKMPSGRASIQRINDPVRVTGLLGSQVIDDLRHLSRLGKSAQRHLFRIRLHLGCRVTRLGK